VRIFRVQRHGWIDWITEDAHAMTKRPYPLYVDEEGKVQNQDLWEGDPFGVIGFQNDLACQTIDLTWRDAVADPEQVVGTYLVTCDDKGNWAVYETAVEAFHEIDR